jgi:hypothetical protein
MGQMKKLYEMTAEQDMPFLYFMQRTTDLTVACERALDLIRQSEFLISDWLRENTNQPFNEQADLDAARSFLEDAMDLLQGPTQSRERRA